MSFPTPDAGLPIGPDRLIESSSVIERSWQRCVALGLPVDQPSYNEPLPGGRLREARERNGMLLHLAAPELDTLYRAMMQADGIVLLTDNQGLILEARGDTAFMDRARQVSLLPGAEWSEAREGTNAVGTALAESAMVEVLGSQHYLSENRFLVCTAMPVFDPLGHTAGVLDLSGDVRRAHPHARTLVQLAVAHLEHRWTTHLAGPGDYSVHVHPHPAWLDTPHEGVLVFRDGRLVGANRVGLALLGLSASAIGRARWDALFDVPLNEGDHSLPQRADGRMLQLRVRRRPVPLRSAPAGAGAVTVRGGVVWDAATEPLLAKARRALDAGIPVLLHGETGTGKEMFVRAVHQASTRATGPLVAVNCAAIPESLIESELFGYSPGAFTGARRGGASGRLREADGGVLFLDEIGDMPQALQARLLRVLQDKVVQPLGGGRPSPVDFIVIAATHRPLDQDVGAGRFRADLYYRLRHLTLTLPPLRERPDLTPIIEAMLLEAGASARGIRLTARARERLLAHDWPGNFRELANLLRTLVALADDGAVIGCAELPPEFHAPAAPAAVVPLKDAQSDTIREALASCGGNISAAARRLGIHRATLHRKLKRLDAQD